MRSILSLGLLAAFLVALCEAYPARPSPFRLPIDQQAAEVVLVPQAMTVAQQDLLTAATGDGHHGRVQIKVYRGPTKGHGHEHFAPYGFWVKQPADEGHHY